MERSKGVLQMQEDEQLIRDFSNDQPDQEELYREYHEISESEDHSQGD